MLIAKLIMKVSRNIELFIYGDNMLHLKNPDIWDPLNLALSKVIFLQGNCILPTIFFHMIPHMYKTATVTGCIRAQTLNSLGWMLCITPEGSNPLLAVFVQLTVTVVHNSVLMVDFPRQRCFPTMIMWTCVKLKVVKSRVLSIDSN